MSMDQYPSDVVLRRERRARPPREEFEKTNEGMQSTFVQCLSHIALLAAEHDMPTETEVVFEFLTMVLAEPECLSTACALIYAKRGHLAQSEQWLRKILDDKPDYDAARVSLAGIWAMQNKPGWRPLVEKVLATSLDPLARTAAQKIMESHP
jgi:hypothetical protein